MAQDSETTRAQVKAKAPQKRISRPRGPGTITGPQPQGNTGGRALNEARTVHKQQAVQHSRGPTGITAKPHGDVAHSGGEALHRARSTPEHKQHTELVGLARQIIKAHSDLPAQGVQGDTKGDFERLTADAYKSSNAFRNSLEDARVAKEDYQAQKAAEAAQAAHDKYRGNAGKLLLGAIQLKGPTGDFINAASDVAGAGVKAAASVTSAVAKEEQKLGVFGAIPGAGGVWKEFSKAHPKSAEKIAGNFGAEVVNIPANTIPSLYHALEPLGRGALSGNSKELGAGGMESLKRLTDPYVNLATHPGKTVEKNPLSSILMVGGLAKGLDRVAGRVEQGAYPHIETKVTNTPTTKFTDHPLAPKPGSAEFKKVVDRANKAANLGARGGTAGERAAGEAAGKRILSNAKLESTPQGIKPKQVKSTTISSTSKKVLTSIASRPYQHIEIKLPGTAAKQVVLPRQGALAFRLQKSRAKNVTRMPDKEINKRIDDTFYTALNQSRQDAYDAIANHQHNHPDASKAKLEQVAKDQLQKSRDFYRDQSALDMALRDKNGVVRKFYGGKFDDATKYIHRWGQNLINQGKNAHIETYQHGDKTLKGIRHSVDVHTLAPYVLKTGPNAGKTILAPKLAIDRLAEHDSYLKQTTTSALLQSVGGTFRRTVLPFSPKWLLNNYTEAALRGAINGVGPTSLKGANKFYDSLSESGKKEFNQLVKSVGHGGMQRQLLQEGTKWEEKLTDTAHWKFGQDLTKFGQMKGPKAANFLFDKWTDIAFHHLNGHMENQVHLGMAGRVLRRHPLMSKKLLDVTHEAMKNPEGPATVEQRNNLITMGREVDRMFGKYGKFSPDLRRNIATWTPFIPWSLNAVHFITRHLPADHPVVTSLIASAHQSSQEWRNKHGLGYFIDGSLPPFLQGSVPGSNNSHWMIFSQGTPFSFAGDPTGNAANSFNPLGSTIQNNLLGLDWKGDKLKNDNPAVRLQTALLSALESTTPIGYAANRITGGNDGAGANLEKWANPVHPIKGKDATTGKPKKAPGLFSKSGANQPSMFHGGSSSGTPSLFGP